MLSKSKIDITNQLDKMSLEETIRGMMMALGLFDQDQVSKILDRLPKEDKEVAMKAMVLLLLKMSMSQTKLLLKALLGMDYYTRITSTLLSEPDIPFDKESSEKNIACQEDMEKRIQEIDTDTKGVLKLPVLDDAFGGLGEYFDQWAGHAFRASQDLGLLPKDTEKAKAIIRERAEKLEAERKVASQLVQDENKSP